MAAPRRAARQHQTLACVLRRSPYGDSDLIVGLFTRELGQISALARSARKSQRRFGGALEPLQTLQVELSDSGGDLLGLRDTRVVVARPHLLTHLASLTAAGQFSSWVRHAAPEATPEPLLWELMQQCLDRLEQAARDRAEALARGEPEPVTVPSAPLTLAAHGLQLLVACGWRLELEYCVQSGMRCPEGKAAMIDPERGGLVSKTHGGAPFRVDGATRRRLIAAQAGDAESLLESDADLALSLIGRCLVAHAGLPA